MSQISHELFLLIIKYLHTLYIFLPINLERFFVMTACASRIIKLSLYCITGLLLLIILNWGIQIIQSRLYEFPIPQSFSGPVLYNPYANAQGPWLKCNFHAHAKTHFGLTNGKQPGDEVIDHYRDLNYDLISISDYQSINPHQNTDSPCFVPFYEHGYNINKSHQLVSGSHVSPYDLFIYFLKSQKQYTLERLKWNASLVILAHPALQNSYSEKDLTFLSGYDGLEVLNHYRKSISQWDAALSAGKPVWGFGNDDTHNIENPNETAVNWTMINSDSPERHQIYKAIKKGHTISVSGFGGINDNELDSVLVNGMNIKYTFKSPADSIRLVGENGTIKALFYATRTAQYEFTSQDTYIRAEVYNPETTMYLNPVFRYDGKEIPINALTAKVQWNRTILMRAGIIAFYLFLLSTLLKAYLGQIYWRLYLPGYRRAKSIFTQITGYLF